jgi:radical SAM superfamily enzyme YgiQ (UPF0313 family)
MTTSNRTFSTKSGRKGRRWADELIARMHDTGLAENTIWKISCRAEYVEPELFAAMRDAGLFLVYMGIESGVEAGLDILFKQMTVEQNLNAVATLKRLDIVYSYGFMLFDPSSTFASVRQNIGLSAPTRRRRQRAGGVLAHAAVRRHADPRFAVKRGAVARRLDTPRLRLSRPAA